MVPNYVALLPITLTGPAAHWRGFRLAGGRASIDGRSRSSDSGSGRWSAESKFPYRVDIPVPVGGLGTRRTEMLIWCRGNIAAGTCAQHGHSERSKARATPAVTARFYITSEADAEMFRELWGAD